MAKAQSRIRQNQLYLNYFINVEAEGSSLFFHPFLYGGSTKLLSYIVFKKSQAPFLRSGFELHFLYQKKSFYNQIPFKPSLNLLLNG